MDLPSVLGGLAQGFADFGKSAVDLFGTGGAAFADLIQGTGTKNQDDFRKWLYQTDSVKDAAAKGLGTALNGAQTVSDYVVPGGISKSLLFNAGQGALGGLADEFKTYGENYDLGRAGQRALVSAGAAGAGTGLANALKKSGSGLLQSGLAQGASRGALSGAINQGGYAAIDGGDIAQSALQGAGMGALLGGATGAVQDFMPRKQQYMPLTEEEKTARIANAKQMLETATTPERRAELQAQINRLGGTLENVLAADDMAVNNPKLSPEQQAYFEGSVLRDDQGNLIPVYHSSPNKFTAFDDNMLGENTMYGNTKYGHFVTPDKDFSARFRDIDNTGVDGNTMELYANVKKPITHPYNAELKYEGKELDDIVENWLKVTGNGEVLDELKSYAKENGTSIYDEYMDLMFGNDPYEYAADERDALKNAGYDAVEILEGPRDQLVVGATENTPVSSYAIFGSNQLKDINNLKPTSDVDIMASLEPEGFTYDYDGSDMAAVQRAYNLATQDQAKLDGMLKEISDTLGTEFSSAGQKSMESMLNKVERKVRSGRDYTVSSMKDHTRGKVMMNNFSEIPQVLQELDRRGIPYDTEVVTNDWGYKGYHITFRNPDGISSEIQLTTSDHWPAKLESDAIYDKWRNFNLGTASKTERQRYNDAMAKSQALWAKVDFNDFDKAVQSLSDTGRASRSVAPVTSKLGLTQEPSLYTKTPSPSESANMSPSSVTRTFSGLGFDKSPNINKTPFDDIIPQNTSRTLEGVLSADDLKVNSAKIAPGQLDLFSDYKPKPKAEAPVNGLDYYGSDIEMLAPGNPYAPVNGKITQEMRDRANYIIDDLALHRQIPENELYNQINPETLPKGHYETGKILDEAYSNNQSIRPLINNIVEEKFTEQFGDSPSKEKLISYLYGDGDADSKKMAVNKDIGIYMEPEKLHEKTLKDLARSRIKTDLYGEGLYALSEENKTVRGGYTGALDSALSERLGIAPGNTYKKIGNYDQGSWVAGRYARSKSHAGDENIMVGPAADNEKALSTLGHERLHSFQAETKEVPGRENRYSQEVKDAYTELAKDLKAAKAYKTGKEIKDWYGRDVAYWRLHDEQEARMFQQYLADNGYTGQQPKASNRVYHPLGAKEFDSARINPAFDKFIDKLRDLSKRGVALPALAGLVGGGAILEQILNSKEEDKKKTNKRSA